MPKNKQRYIINSIEKAFDVIETLAVHQSLNLIELSEILDQPKSSVYRILLTLEHRGYIMRDSRDGKYRTGLKFLEISKNILEHNSLRTATSSEMNKLVHKYGDTVNLGVLQEHEIIYIDIREGTNALRMIDDIGSVAPIHASSIGKAIAAHIDEQLLDNILENTKLEALTKNTIIDKNELKKELQTVKDNGYAIDDEEVVRGAKCVAAPIFNLFGQVEGAISLSGAVHRFSDDQINQIIADITQSAKIISQKLGYVGMAN